MSLILFSRVPTINMSKRARSPSLNDTADAPAPKAVCIQDLVDPLAFNLIMYELFPRGSVECGQWKALDAWKHVSRAARESVKVALRDLLFPRYIALVKALGTWGKLPLETRFEFPVPRGPLPVTWVDECSSGNRNAVRPKNARAGETLMPRSLWVWAVTHSLFDTQAFPKADIPAAIDDCKARYPHGVYYEPAFDIMSDLEGNKEQHPDHYERWSMAPNYSIPAFISTFTCWRYQGSLNMGAPGNNQRFLKALLKQAWPTHADLPRAIAFLLLWAQHTLFHTWVTDDTFRQSAVDRLVVELIFEWRHVVPTEISVESTSEETIARLVDWSAFAFHRYWFKTHPKDFVGILTVPKGKSAVRTFKDDMKDGLDTLRKIALPVATTN